MEGQNGSSYIRVLIVRFKNEISLSEINLFRGAIIHSMENANVLFHNHIDDNKFRYSYPLIQYKRIQGKAAILCINEGVDAIGQFLSKCDFNFQIGNRLVHMETDSLKTDKFPLQISDKEYHYHIQQWLPLNEENFSKYKKIENLDEKIHFLEKILIGNILSMSKGLNQYIDKQIYTKITDIIDTQVIKYKEIKLLSLDIDFKANIYMPEYIGLGKEVSLGLGMITKIKS